MRDLSWLKRAFDTRLKYVSGLPIPFLATLLLFEVIPLPELPEGWLKPFRLVLVFALCVAALFGYVAEKDRRHSFARGFGWSSVGAIAGALFSAAVVREALPLWVAGLEAIFLAAALFTDWRERNLAEE